MMNVSHWKRWMVSFIAVVVLMPGFVVANGGADTSTPSDPNYNSVAEYTDVPQQAYYSQALQVFTTLGTIAPSKEGTFDPQHRMTRGEFAALLAAALFLPDDTTTSAFTDMGKDHPNAGAVNALHAKGIITGYADRTFRPDESITRAQTAVMLAKAFGLPDMPELAVKFSDIPTGAWYAGAVGSLVNYRVITGRSAHLYAPESVVTKAESITFIYRKLYRVFNIENISDSNVTIDGENYTVSKSLAGLFNPSNRDALMHAKITFTPRDHQIISVEGLELTNNKLKAESADFVVLNGGGSTINGSLIVGSDNLKLTNITIKGDMFITKNVKHQLYTDQLSVEGNTFLLANRNAQPDDELILSYTRTTFGTLLISRGVRLHKVADDGGSVANTNDAKAGRIKNAKEVKVLAATQYEQIQQLYVAYFNRPADPAGLAYWQSVVESSNGSTAAVSAAFQAQLDTTSLNSAISNMNSVNSVYNNLFGRDSNDGANDWLSAILNNGPPTPTNANTLLALIQTIENSTASFTSPFLSIATPEVNLDSGNFNVIADGNTNLTVGTNAIVPNLTLHNVETFNFTGSIQTAFIQNDDHAPITHLTGSGTFTTFNVINPVTTFELSSQIIIHNLVPPVGVNPSQLISNYVVISSQINNINGQPNPTNVIQNSSPPSNNSNQPPTVPGFTYYIETGGGLTGAITVQTSHTVKLYYVFNLYDSTVPSAAQIKAGKTSGGTPPLNGSAGNVTVASNQAIFNIQNLAPGESNTIHVVAENANGVLSEVKSLPIITEDVLYPMIINASYSVAKGDDNKTKVTFTVYTKNTSNLYYVILFPGTEGNSNAPSAEQISEGKSASGNSPATNGTAGVVEDVNYANSIPSIFEVELISLLTYNVYFVAEDSDGELSIPFMRTISTPLWQ